MLQNKALVLAGLMLCLIAQSPAFAAGKEKVLHTFQNQPAANPGSTLILDDAGNLYGSTFNSGHPKCQCGTVFRLSPQSTGKWTYEVLYEFKGSADGGNPIGKLVFDKMGNLYGVTTLGLGSVFQLASKQDGSWVETTIYTFKDSPDGARPISGLTIDMLGNLYGTTPWGGANSTGLVYKLSPTGNGWSETVLYSFSGTDGEFPVAGVTLDSDGSIYGTTKFGGAYGHGTVFEISSSGGIWYETNLYSFLGGANHGEPAAGVLVDKSGKVYGTLSDDTEGYPGAIFQLRPNSKRAWVKTVLHNFGERSDGAYPQSDMVVDSHGTLYGTTLGGGKSGNGVIYELARNGKGNWKETVFHSFNYVDGTYPWEDSVTFDASGDLFVPVFYGGLSKGYDGYGVILEFATAR